MNEGRRFIAEVKKHECLWQTSHVTYGDKDVKTKAWQQVLETLYPEWDTLPIEDKMNKGNDVQRRWKNIRDSFKKELNKQQKASKRNIEKRKKYKYFDDLLFLIPQSAASEKSMQETLLIKQEYNVDESDECDSNDTPPPIKQMHREREGISTPNDCVDTNNIAPSSSCESNQKTESFEKILIDFLSNFVRECQPENVSNSRIGTQSFEDVAFFMSLVPSVQKLNDDQKLTFRMEVLNALKKVRNSCRDGYS